MDELAYLYLAILVAILYQIRRYSGLRTRKVYAFGLEGAAGGQINRIVDLDMVKDGNMLKEVLTGKMVAVVTNTITYFTKKKEIKAYLVDLDHGCTCDIMKQEKMMDIEIPGAEEKTTKTTFTIKTDPDLIGGVIDSRIISDAFAIKPSRGMIIVATLIGIAVGLIVGKAF